MLIFAVFTVNIENSEISNSSVRVEGGDYHGFLIESRCSSLKVRFKIKTAKIKYFLLSL